MTNDQIKAVFDRVQTWPKERQEDAARVLLSMEAHDGAPYILSEEERADIHAALEEVARGELAHSAEAAAVFARYRE